MNSNNALGWLCAVLLSFVSMPAHAIIEEPYFTPAIPLAGQEITLNVASGYCDAALYMQGYPQITRKGSSIRILIYGARFTEPVYCVFPYGISQYAFGSLEEGSYEVTVDMVYEDGAGNPVTITLAVLPLVVSAPAGPVATPTNSFLSLLLLVLMLALSVRSKNLVARALSCVAVVSTSGVCTQRGRRWLSLDN